MRAASRIVSAAEAVAAIPSGATVAVGGFVGAGHPEMLSSALERRFLETGLPRDLTLLYCAGQGDREERGLNHLAHTGLLKRVIGGHWNLAPKLGRMALAGEIEAYNFPQGVLCVLLREIAAKRPGVFTRIGMNTFIDPVNGGGRLNSRTTEPLVERVLLDGEDWLRYRAFPVTVGLIRATTADARGNLTLEREALIGEVLPIAQAARNHGGIVIAQVERVVERIADPKAVRVPGMLVDFIVVSGGAQHDQTFAEPFNEAYVVGQASRLPAGHFARELDAGEAPAETGETPAPLIMPFSERKIIGRRVLREIRAGDIVNLGIGVPEAVASVAAETGRLAEFTLTLESGPIGGVPAGGLSFGCSAHPEAVVDQPSQFDFYDGGGLDIAVLGALEVDAEGSVNVSTLGGGRFAGVGGFVNITQSAKRVVFASTFRADGLEVYAKGGALRITREGAKAKFVKRVAQVCFHGPSAVARGQQVLYVTERAVFELKADGLHLLELAPGVDLNAGVLEQMDFAPHVARLKLMPSDCFAK